MNKQKKLLPAWLVVIIDILIIAVYVAGFYCTYYLKPRKLESSGIKTAQKVTIDDTSEKNAISEDTSGSSDSAGSNTSSSVESLSTKFAEHFTDTVVSTSNSYSSKNISITVNQYTEGSGKDVVTYYIADIYIANIKCLQSGFAENTYGVDYTDTVLDMDKSLGVLLAINGDYYGNGGDGVVIRNGEVYRSTTSDYDVCVLYYDGTMKTFSADEFNVDQAITDGAYQAWCFGPELLDEYGNNTTEFATNRHVIEMNPRSAIGYYEPGHYCLVVVDGRQSGYSNGMTLTQLSELFETLGCSSAYNLDGGKSSSMTFNDTEVNQACDGGREVSDCILIKEVD